MPLQRGTVEPVHCVCMNAPDSPSTHRGPVHFCSACKHSTLKETTSGRKAPTLRRIPGTRGVTVVLDGEEPDR